MISVFQIFRALMGVIVFIFVITFFLRMSDMYTATQIKGSKMEMVNAFDYVAMQTYTSGNPATFPGFEGFETLVYEPPKIKSDAGQHTLSVPVFFVPGRGEISMERRCLDFGWFKWCMVFAFPAKSKILFTPIENTNATRDLILEIVENLPGSLEYGFCNGADARTANKDEFLSYLASGAGVTYQPCETQLPEYCRLVTITASTGSSSNLTENHIIINPSTRLVSEENSSGGLESRPYHDWMDIAVFITGGVKALDYKKAVFSRELAASAGIMHGRSVLVSQRIKEYNIQPCLECSTPFPTPCGWTDYLGREHESGIYHDFISSLVSLKNAISSGNYHQLLEDTASKYNELKNQGCE